MGSDRFSEDPGSQENPFVCHSFMSIFGALQTAYEQAKIAKKADPNRFYSIVLMTDGLNQDGISYTDFNNFYAKEADYVAGVRAFPILFGELILGK